MFFGWFGFMFLLYFILTVNFSHSFRCTHSIALIPLHSFRCTNNDHNHPDHNNHPNLNHRIGDDQRQQWQQR